MRQLRKTRRFVTKGRAEMGVGKRAEMFGYLGRIAESSNFFWICPGMVRNGLGKPGEVLFGGPGEQQTKKLPSCGPESFH